MKEVIIGDSKWEKREKLDWRDGKPFIGDTEFDGHHTLWGFEYFPTTYLKSSELSGDEYRKGGEIRYFKDRKQCYSEFCREPEKAVLRIGMTLLKLMDFDWNRYEEGKKLYWRDTPALIKHLIPEQGALIVAVDGAERFPDPPHADEEWEKLENPTEVKIDIFDPHVWWYRNEPRFPTNDSKPLNQTGDNSAPTN